jgi:hypothetical protein
MMGLLSILVAKIPGAVGIKASHRIIAQLDLAGEHRDFDPARDRFGSPGDIAVRGYDWLQTGKAG